MIPKDLLEKMTWEYDSVTIDINIYLWPQAGEQSLERHTFRISLVQWHPAHPPPGHTHTVQPAQVLSLVRELRSHSGAKKTEAHLYPQGQTRHELVYSLPRKHTSPVMLHATSEDLQLAKNLLPIQERDSGLIPGSGRSPGGGHGNLLQCSCLENAMEKGACRLRFIEVQRVQYDWSDLAHSTLCFLLFNILQFW